VEITAEHGEGRANNHRSTIPLIITQQMRRKGMLKREALRNEWQQKVATSGEPLL